MYGRLTLQLGESRSVGAGESMFGTLFPLQSARLPARNTVIVLGDFNTQLLPTPGHTGSALKKGISVETTRRI